LPEVEQPPPPPPLPTVPVDPVRATAAAAAPGIGFRNKVAVRIGLLAAALSSLLTTLPIPPMFSIIWMPVCLVGAGFFSVYLYRRRTGEDLPAKLGAKMGWVTGIFCFAIAVVIFTISMIAISMQGGLASFYQEQLASQTTPGVDLEEFYKLLESPGGIGAILFFSLIMLFLFFTLLPTLGGAMGAKVLEKE
jgi:hypothetical protein